MEIRGIPIREFASANSLTKKEFVKLCRENGWRCYPNRYSELEVNFGRLGRFSYFNADRDSLAGFKKPASMKK